MQNTEQNLSGKTIMVTGATAGIGEATAQELARKGATVVLISRNPEKCAATAARIQQETNNPNVNYISADLSSQAQIHELVVQFLSRYDRLDVLINNVGAFFLERRLSIDGVEMTFALNHLSYFLLTNLLLDIIKASAPARVVNVSSNAHFKAALEFDNLQSWRDYFVYTAYKRSKFANVLFTYELARRIKGSDVTVNALHPGIVGTDIAKNVNRWVGVGWRNFARYSSVLTPAQGAETSVYLAASPEVETVTEKYFVKCKEAPSDPATYDRAAAWRLWEISAKMVKL
jgi:NAD(P)-dependent dehydrogenase (short-subunit alcohol dehydrogenase family)